MRRPAIVAIDQGTTNTKALLFSTDGSLLAHRSRNVATGHPQPGWAEQSAAEIWTASQGVLNDIAEEAAGYEVVALGISNQRETTLLWDRATGEPLTPAVLWQCRRTSPTCEALRQAGRGALVLERTGLVLDPLFPSTKLRWLLENDPGLAERARRGEVAAGTIDSWLIYNLTAGRVHATDHSNASRTQLFDLDLLKWSSDLLELFGVPATVLPEIRPSDADFGRIDAVAVGAFAGVPIRGVLGDSHAALFGHGIRTAGQAKVTFGTGSSIMALSGERVTSAAGLSTTLAWSRGGEVSFALEGNITVSGHAAAFAARLLGVENEAALSALAQTVGDADGVSFVPAMAGLGAPHWDDEARGLICGMTLRSEPAHIARATFEAIAHQVADVVAAMESDLGAALEGLSVDGGASRNEFLMQLVADLCGREVRRPALGEASGLGAARMAGEACARWERREGLDAVMFAPHLLENGRSQLRGYWSAAVDRTRVCKGRVS